MCAGCVGKGDGRFVYVARTSRGSSKTERKIGPRRAIKRVQKQRDAISLREMIAIAGERG